MKMKRILTILLSVLFVFTSLAACSSASTEIESADTTTEEETAATTEESTAAAETTVQETEEEANSLVVADESEYVDMSMDELYQAALQEGGTLVVYSETSSTAKSVAKFQEEYPEIAVEVTKYKTNDIATLIPLEAQSENAYCDLVVTSDGSGSLYQEWYSDGYVVAYYPAAIVDDLKADYISYGLPICMEADIWYYNTEAFPDGAPVSNWWDIVEMDENGESIYNLYMHDASNLNTASMLSNLVLHSDELEAAYKEKYGTDIEYTYDASELGVEENNAGFEWMYRYLQCNYVVFTDSDEIFATVNLSTAEDPALGFGSGIKLGDCLESGMNVAYVTTLSPFNGFVRAKYVYICTNTDNPAAAHLLTLYMMGGDDGQGAGYGAYVDRTGCYATRISHDDLAYNEFELDDLNVLPTDLDFVYNNYLDIQDFWTYYADIFN